MLKYAGMQDRADALLAWIPAVKNGDPSNIEGHAAAIYWRSLFSDFTRERYSDDERNHALNYGYTVLRGHSIRAVMADGLNPGLGIHHGNSSNAYALADDLIEPFRPAVDFAVLQLL